MQVIETNVMYHGDSITDHQSRIIKTDSWEDYISLYNRYSGDTAGNYNGTLLGYSLPKNAHINSLKYDDFHLRCNLTLFNNEDILKLAYLVK